MIYLAPKLSNYRKAVEGYIFFEPTLTDIQKKEIEGLIPVPLNLNTNWDDDILHFATDDKFSARIHHKLKFPVFL